MSCCGPDHYNQRFASTTQFWSGTDSEQNFKTNCSVPSKLARLQSLNWIDSEPLTYVYNSEGFRDCEFDQQSAGLALGCSHTEGVGIRVENTWPVQLQNMLGQKIWNLGVGGAALDTCYRILEYWIEHLNVKFVFCAVPYIARYEVFEMNHWLNVVPGEKTVPSWLHKFHQNYLAYDQSSELNQRKNLQAMQYICIKHNVPFYIDLLEDFRDNCSARDLMHCGPTANRILATKFFNNIKGNQNGTNTVSSN